MKKTVIALATAASMCLVAGPAAANDSTNQSASGSQNQSQSQQNQNLNQGQNQGMASNNNATMDSEQAFSDLDRNDDDILDEDELNTFGSTAAGTMGGAEEDLGEENLEFYDMDDDDAVTLDEFESQNEAGALEAEDTLDDDY